MEKLIILWYNRNRNLQTNQPMKYENESVEQTYNVCRKRVVRQETKKEGCNGSLCESRKSDNGVSWLDVSWQKNI